MTQGGYLRGHSRLPDSVDTLKALSQTLVEWDGLGSSTNCPCCRTGVSLVHTSLPPAKKRDCAERPSCCEAALGVLPTKPSIPPRTLLQCQKLVTQNKHNPPLF